jgi:hypothetical protein
VQGHPTVVQFSGVKTPSYSQQPNVIVHIFNQSFRVAALPNAHGICIVQVQTWTHIRSSSTGSINLIPISLLLMHVSRNFLTLSFHVLIIQYFINPCIHSIGVCIKFYFIYKNYDIKYSVVTFLLRMLFQLKSCNADIIQRGKTFTLASVSIPTFWCQKDIDVGSFFMPSQTLNSLDSGVYHTSSSSTQLHLMFIAHWNRKLVHLSLG